MTSFEDAVKEAGCHDLASVVETAAGKLLCFSRLDRDTLHLCVSDGYDLWKLALDSEEFDVQRDLADMSMDAYLSKIRAAFHASDIMVSQVGVKCNLSLGHGAKAVDFELYEAKAVDKKTELQSVLFRLAERTSDLEHKLEKSTQMVEALKQQKAAGGRGGGVFDMGDGGKKKKNQPKAAPQQAGMSVINPGSKKRKAARGVQYD